MSALPPVELGFRPLRQSCYGTGVTEILSPLSPRAAVYGAPPADLVDVPDGALQLSPLRPGGGAFEALADGALDALTVAAPPGSIERRYVLAQALRTLALGGALTVLAPKDKGGQRLRAELEGFGCEVAERSKARQRICGTQKPADPNGLAEAIAEGSPSFVEAIGLHSQPGIFSWNRIDPGSALLLRHLPPLAGRGADLGAGLGILSKAVLASPKVEALTLVEIDRRAVEAARLNVADPRAAVLWADARETGLGDLDFVVSNPPFHAEGIEDRGLGQAFITAAARMLRRSGALLLVANRHMPYEDVLRTSFRSVETRVEEAGYKIFEARK
ncbi:class I SAM-dependent methyltransferase [Aureimonas sp. AU40]|uniref:class I SAM-dependent methyltransferase n=1 Tax=Aureimonas sp. AU40 TaxID=1637747 RepID=UPI0009E91F03|nr:class I SAM-dependent methyltransferase [Aureimonas sp. AU40]